MEYLLPKFYVPSHEDLPAGVDNRSEHTSLCLKENPHHEPPLVLDRNSLVGFDELLIQISKKTDDFNKT